MRTIIIEENNTGDLEYRVNVELIKHPADKIFDIKYSGCGSFNGYSCTRYSAMIILKE